ncbi:MAG TPA: GNAT family N-acetyltransferase [Gaiellaceae bacterium]
MEVFEPTREQVLRFCARDPIERVFLEDVARRGLGRFCAVADGDGELTALCHAGANLVPSGDGCEAFAAVAVSTRSRMLIGEARAVGDVWEAARTRLPAPREDRPGQPVYAISEPPEPGDSGLRPATRADLDRLVPACAAAHELELGIDPLARDAEAFRWRTATQIDEGRSWLWLENDVVLFKAESSAWTPSAVQISQVWTDHEARGRGYAQRGMRDLVRLLLEHVPTVTLFVRRENAPAIALYDRIGMRRVLEYRSVLF